MGIVVSVAALVLYVLAWLFIHSDLLRCIL